MVKGPVRVQSSESWFLGRQQSWTQGQGTWDPNSLDSKPHSTPKSCVPMGKSLNLPVPWCPPGEGDGASLTGRLED